MSVHTLHAMTHGAAEPTVYDGVTNLVTDPGLEELVIGDDGAVFNSGIFVMNTTPEIRVTTVKLDDWLTLLTDTDSVSGATMDGTDVAKFYYQELSATAQRETTGDVVTVNNGIIVPRTISASRGQPATLECGAIPVKTDGSAPYTVATEETLPSLNTGDELWTVGPITLNAGNIDWIQEWQLDWGFDVQRVRHDGTVWPNSLFVATIAPVLTFTTKASALSTITTLGADDAVTAQLLKVNPTTGARVGSGDKTFTISAGITKVTAYQAAAGSEADTMVTVTAITDGTNDPVEVS